MVYQKYSSKRPVFKPAFRKEEPNFNNCSKFEALEKVRPTGSASADGLKCAEGAGEFVAMFKKSSGKSVSISSASLKRARSVLGEDLSSDLVDLESAGSQQSSEGVGLFQTAAGNPLAISTFSKKAQSFCYENLVSGVLESHSTPVSYTKNEMRTISQTTEGDSAAVRLSSIKRVQSIICEHPTMELFESRDKSVHQTMNEDMKMFDAATEIHMTVSSSVSQTTSNFEAVAKNPAAVSSLSIKRAENVLEGDTSLRVPKLHTRPKSQTIKKAPSLFQTASKNPVTVLPSSIKKAQAIFGEACTSEVHESDTGFTPEKANTIFQTTPGNLVSVPSSCNKKAKTMTSNEPSEIVDHGRPKPMVSTSSTTFQTAAGNCLNMPFIGINKSENNMQKEKDMQTRQNDNENDLRSTKGSCRTALIFQTAAGKPVAVAMSSVRRALSIFSDDDNLGVNGGNDTTGIFQNTFEKPLEALLRSDEGGETVLGKERIDKIDLVISEAEDREKKNEFQLACVDPSKLYESNDASFDAVNNSTLSIVVSGFQTSLKETRCDRSFLNESGCDGSPLKESGCDRSSQRAIALQMTSNSVDTPHPKEFLVNGHDTEHGRDYSRKFLVEQDPNFNVIDPQISASSSPPTGSTAEIGKVCQKYSRKRPVFKSSFRNEEPKFNNCSKFDALKKARPSGNASADGLTCSKGAGNFAGMFKKASGKSVSISSSSLERARTVLGKDLGTDLIDPGCAGPSQNREDMGLFPTASIIPLAVTTSSIKKAQPLCFEDLASEVLESRNMPVPHTENEITTFQTTEGDPVAVPSSSIRRPQSIISEHPTVELFKSHDRSVPQIMNKDMKMFGAVTENHVTVLSSLSQTTSNVELATGNPVSISSLSTQRAENESEGDTSKLQTINKATAMFVNKATAMFETASGNPVTVLPSSIKKAQAIFGKASTLEVHESDTGSTLQKANIMFQTTPGNTVSVQSSSDKKAKNMSSNEPSVIVDHGKPKPMVNTSSAVFQTATGNCLKMSFVGIKKSETNVQKENDIQIGQNDNENDLSSNNGICRTALIFQTAAGKPVAVSMSSVKRALSILGDDDNLVNNGGNDTTGIFQNSIEKPAEALLPSDEAGESILGKDRTDIGNLVISKAEDDEKKHKLHLGCADQPKLYDSDNAAFEFVNIPTVSIFVPGETAEESKFAAPKTLSHQSLFQTGSGKPVNISMSGISKAKALLESEGVEAPTTNKTYETHENFANVLSDSAFDQSNLLSDRVSTITANCHNICSVGKADSGSSQMHQFTFQTAAGRSVNVSTNAMKRAMDLLGDEANNSTVGMKSLGNPENNTVVSCGPPPLLFQTGSGRSVSVSSAAMKRARNILGEMSGVSSAATDQQRLSAPTDLKRLSTDFGNAIAGVSPRTPRHCQDAVSNKENLPYANHVSQVVKTGMNGVASKLPHLTTEASSGELILVSGDSGARKLGKRKVCMSPLAEISNKSPLCDNDNYLQRPTATPTVHKSLSGSKRGLFRSRRVTPFKQPRRSIFLSPNDKMPKSVVMEPNLSVQSFPQGAPCEVKFQFCYPSTQKRKTIQEYFGGPPDHQQALWHLSTEIQFMTSDSSQHYNFNAKCGSGYDNFIAGDFRKMLLESGADPRHATIEWVENHYKWIVWKLACIERSYARQAGGKYLTVQNVLEELKYRYEREANRGHRSPLKKIVEGDAVAAGMMVLCVSAIRVWPDQKHNEPFPVKGSMEVSKESENHTSNGISKPSSDNCAKIELTDGWYCLNAILDEPLSKQLLHGKLFIGQKLRICGASLHGWVGPLSPLEAFQTVSLVLHINGTYRAHWAERLSFCRGLPVPLAFRCIKEGGGPVPRTLVGITRIYPTLYKERLANRAYIIRSERAEDKTLYLYNERRTHIVEDIMLKAEKENFHSSLDSNKDEGARLYSVLEHASEPELIMADMTSAQLAAFAAYQSKREAIRQASIEKNIQKALENADLDSRKVTPFMKVRIVGLTRKCLTKIKEKGEMRGLLKQEGLVTIWQPTENHFFNLKEGAIYCVSGLVPLGGRSGDSYSRNILQFQANRSTVWHRIPQSVCHNFEFMYNPRSALQLSDLVKVPLHSEFDVAVFVLHIEEPYPYGLRKRQWLFTSDGSVELDCWNKQSEIILAIDISLPCDSFIALDHSLAGSTVGLCNLVKQKRDQKNNLWVAEMTESSIHSVNFNATNFGHLKAAAELTDKWAKVSAHAVQKLSERVSSIIKNAV